MQIVDNGVAAQIEEILALPTIVRSPSLPSTNMSKGMLNCHPFTQLGAPLWGLLTLA